MRKLIKRFRGEQGQALVELAFVIPLVLLFLFAIIDFGLALNEQNSDTNIANIAVREAAVFGSATTNFPTCGGQTKTTLYLWTVCESGALGGPTVTSVCVYDTNSSTNGTSYATGDPIEVKVSSPFSWMKLVSGASGGPATSIGANATMREEATLTNTNPAFLQNPTGC